MNGDARIHRHKGREGTDFPDHHGVAYSTGSDYLHGGIDVEAVGLVGAMTNTDCPVRLPGDGRHHWQAGPVLDSVVTDLGPDGGSFVEAKYVLLVCACGATRAIEPPSGVTRKLAQEGA